ncbi:MAG: GTPase [Candidatus Woesearchaeota archaeon]
MNFQDLRKIEDDRFYLDLAFKESKKKGHAAYLKSNGDKTSRIRTAEFEKIKVFCNELKTRLDAITKNFPSIDSIPEFYQELVRNNLDYNFLKKSLGAVAWASTAISQISEEYERKMRHSKNEVDIKKIINSYYGRASSVVKQIKKNLSYIEDARKIMKDFPAIKTDLFTVAITGFPNIGKSTLLSKITPAKPEIKAYAFTTKGLNLGYAKYGINKIQFIDTPGVLAREKRNSIEEQAYLILKYVANIIIYVIDLTEPYPLKIQEQLMKELKEYDKKIIVYLSKTDIISPALITKAKKKYKACTTLEELNKKIEKEIKASQ